MGTELRLADTKHLEFHGDSYRFTLRRGKERIRKKLATDSLSQAIKMRDLFMATGSWHSENFVRQGQEFRKLVDAEPPGEEYPIGHLYETIVTGIEEGHGPDDAVMFSRGYEGEAPLLHKLEEWHSDKRKGPLKDRTKADHRTALVRLVAWMKSKRLAPFASDVTAKIAEAYLDHLVDTRVHPRTGNKALSSIRSMWNFMRVNPNPWARLNMDETNTNDKKERGFKDEEILALLNGPADHTMQAVMRIGAFTGARLDDIFKLKLSDVKGNVYWLVNSKRRGPITKRPVPIHSSILATVEELCRGRGQDEYVIAEGDATGLGRHPFHGILKTVSNLSPQNGS